MTDSHAARFTRLPDRIDAADLTVEVPVAVDDSTTEQPLPAGAPDLIAAARIADAAASPGFFRRPQARIALTIVTLAVGAVAVIGLVQLGN